MPAPVVEVFADVLCPFTHVLLRQFVRRREELDLRLRLRVRAWPLELVNGEPVGVDLVTREIEALRQQVTPSTFEGFSPATFPRTSLPALELAAAADSVAESAGERVSLALRHALFEEGRDVADPVVLEEIARAHGVDRTAGELRAVIEADRSEGVDRGVEGSPHFFVGRWSGFAPGLRVEMPGGDVQVRLDPARFEELMTVSVTAERAL